MVLLGVRERKRGTSAQRLGGVWSGEVAVFCPSCKAFQTVWVSNARLMPTRKFIQEGNHIYHDCGSSQPCRLFPVWGGRW